MYEEVYRSLAKNINRTLGRKAISARKIDALVEEAKWVRTRRGKMGLWQFTSQLPSRYFTPNEIDQLKASPVWGEFSHQLIQILLNERVITPMEAQMVRQYI